MDGNPQPRAARARQFAAAGLAASLGLLATARAQPSASSPHPARLAGHTLLLDGCPVGQPPVLLAVGDRGTILRDGQHVASPTRAMLTGVCAVGEQAWAVGHDGTVIHSLDAGRSWTLLQADPGQRRDIPVPVTLLDVHFFDAGQGLATGSFGLLMRSRDGGKTWSRSRIEWRGFDPELDINEMHLYRLAAAPGGRLFLATDEGMILRSDDRGETWDLRQPDFYGGLFAIHALDRERVVAAGIQGTLLTSRDAGDTWTQIPTRSRSIFHTIIPDGETLYVAGDNGTLLQLEHLNVAASFALDERIAITGGSRHPAVLLTEKGPRPWPEPAPSPAGP